jgi:hypothetical protein
MALKIASLASGQLRHVGTLEQLKRADDGSPLVDAAGSPLVQYETFAEGVRFAIDDWKPTEQFLAQAVTGQLSTRIVIRYRPGMEGAAPNTMRLVHLTNPGASPGTFDYYDIVGAVRDPTMRTQLTLTCTRRDAPGYRTGQTP